MTKLRILLTFLALAPLPLLLSFAIVFLGHSASDSSEYWTVAPWLIIVAFLWTPTWMLIVAIGLAIYVAKRGVRKSSLKHESVVIAAVVVVVFACTYGPFAVWKARLNSRFELADVDEKVGGDLVRSSDAVSKRLKGPFQVFNNYLGLEVNGRRRMIYSASRARSQQQDRVHVVVDIDSTGEERKARIVCILSPEEYGDRPDYENLCLPSVDSGLVTSPEAGS
jgi:hypothetical protein